MKKGICLIMCFLFAGIFLTGCHSKPPKQVINYQRKLKAYFPQESTSATKTQRTRILDLSEGPKLNYDANLGPKDLNFDFKVKTKY